MIDFTGVLKGAFGLIDELYDSDEEKAEAKRKLIQLEQDGKLKEFKAKQSIMLAEAKSQDKWTSRARPSFMYVFYIVILCAIPISILSVFSPESAAQISKAFQAWIGAIPEELWTTFTVGYLGYSASRSYDKKKLGEKNDKG